MKANELMIGDWVKFPIGNEKIIDLPYIEGKGICASFAASATLFPVKVEELKPIPLTPEILKENGFKKEGSWFVIEDDYYDVSIKEITDSIWRVKYCNTEFSTFDCVLRIAFIHELQHALNLFGIDKEIVI